jgi:acyl carrier protein
MGSTLDDTRLRAQVIGILRRIAPELDEAALSDDRPLRRQVDLDSMDWLNLLVGISRELAVDIPEADYGRLVTLADLIGYLKQRRA